MKKSFRIIPLATAAFMALGMSAVSAKTIYYATDAAGTKLVQADSAGLLTAGQKDAFRKAQNSGWKVIIADDNGKVVDWTSALKGKIASYDAALASSTYNNAQLPATSAVVTKIDADGNVTTTLPKTISSIGTVADVAVAVNGTLQLPTTVPVTYSDNTTGTAAVTWSTTSVNLTKAGTYKVTGTVQGTTLKASVNVVVSALPVAKITASTEFVPGITTVKVQFNDATVDGSKYNVSLLGQQLTYTAAGNYFSADITASKATVDAATPVVTAKPVVVAPAASITASAEFVPGITTVKVQFNDATVDGSKWNVSLLGTQLTYNAAGNYFSADITASKATVDAATPVVTAK